MDLDRFTNELLARQAELQARLSRTHQHLFHKQAPVSANFHERSVETANDDLVQALDLEGREELAQVVQALSRIESGDYLSCAVCGGEIGLPRLEALPYTDRCVRCASWQAD